MENIAFGHTEEKVIHSVILGSALEIDVLRYHQNSDRESIKYNCFAGLDCVLRRNEKF